MTLRMSVRSGSQPASLFLVDLAYPLLSNSPMTLLIETWLCPSRSHDGHCVSTEAVSSLSPSSSSKLRRRPFPFPVPRLTAMMSVVCRAALNSSDLMVHSCSQRMAEGLSLFYSMMLVVC